MIEKRTLCKENGNVEWAVAAVHLTPPTGRGNLLQQQRTIIASYKRKEAQKVDLKEWESKLKIAFSAENVSE